MNYLQLKAFLRVNWQKNGSVDSAKDETSITDGATIMAAIKSLETRIYQTFDVHAAEFRK